MMSSLKFVLMGSLLVVSSIASANNGVRFSSFEKKVLRHCSAETQTSYSKAFQQNSLITVAREREDMLAGWLEGDYDSGQPINDETICSAVDFVAGSYIYTESDPALLADYIKFAKENPIRELEQGTRPQVKDMMHFILQNLGEAK